MPSESYSLPCPRIQIRLATPSLTKIPPACQANSPQARIADSSSKNRINFSSAWTTKRFPSPRCASTIQIVSPFSQLVDTDRPFQFQKRSQFFIRTHNETLAVVAVCVSNPDCSPLGLESGLANLPCFPANFPLWRQK